MRPNWVVTGCILLATGFLTTGCPGNGGGVSQAEFDALQAKVDALEAVVEAHRNASRAWAITGTQVVAQLHACHADGTPQCDDPPDVAPPPPPGGDW